MLVAPEGTLPVGWTLPDAAPLPLLSGGFRWELGQQRSSLLLLEPAASEPLPLLDKHRLVPLGEWLPPLPLGLTAGLSAVGGLQPGAPSRAMAGLQPAAAAAICYEISDGRALAAASAEGAQWLLAVANLDPYPQLLQRQFTSLGQLRALESDRDLLSVANTGPTVLIRADGRVQPLLPPLREGVALAELQPRTSQTFYARWRDVLLLPLLVVGLVRLLASR
jgi:apolipoprotein N-acyltransferase